MASKREADLAKLEAAAGTATDDGSWISFTVEFLRLPLAYVPAVQEALRQGRWRQADWPAAYVKKVASHEAGKLGIADPKTDKRLISTADHVGSSGKVIPEADYIDYLKPQGGIQKQKGVWHAISDDYDYDDSSLKERLLEQLPDDLKKEEFVARPITLGNDVGYLLESNLELSWDRIAAKAGLDEWETIVLRYRLAKVSRERAMAEQPTDIERNKLQAAWRRFDRSAMLKLREVLRASAG
jgi:hypothetical protein